MSVKTIAQLHAQIDATFYPNGAKQINAPDHNTFEHDLVDSMVNKIDNLNMIGLSDYDPTRTYNIGFGCFQGNRLLRCIANGTTGTFDPTKWYAITGVIVVDYATALAAHNANGIEQYRLYYISDRNLILRGNSFRQFDCDGYIQMVTPNYDTGILVWEAGSYSGADVRAYNRYVFECTLAVSGITPPDSDATHWLLKDPGDFPGLYLFWWSQCNYDIINDRPYSQKDFYNNEVVNAIGNTFCTDSFRFGDLRVTNCYVNGRKLNNLNNNISYDGARVTKMESNVEVVFDIDGNYNAFSQTITGISGLLDDGAGIIVLKSSSAFVGISITVLDIAQYAPELRNVRFTTDGSISAIAYQGGGGGYMMMKTSPGTVNVIAPFQFIEFDSEQGYWIHIGEHA